MNQDQFLGTLRVLLPLVLPILTANGIIPAGSVNDLSQAIIGLGSVGWAIWAHTDSAKIAAVTALPDIKSVVAVTNPVNTAVKAAVADSSQPKVTETKTNLQDLQRGQTK